ncbi:hypothetical protein N7539_008355 [Penicillium diatomitis]|uniref:U6 snRNA phosphodiesterase n=1 Tax=Penicillium diatomitis TaxID=2819901 RepID=A0A9X0BN74_9EURO|nr:uncharacterized protein N7539_008355 [Penicillium diatomitis]KAJ5475289.1 hypothetical protein N7539_008355 [Penicillium diatomitis]
MSLVPYSDSESDAERSAASPPAKRPRRECSSLTSTSATSQLPPLPRAFHDLYASSTRVSVKDDPSLHGGRKRVIPHMEGNWPTHVYLEWYPGKSELSWLESLLKRANETRPSSHEAEEEEEEEEDGGDDSHDGHSADAVHLHSLLHSDLGAQLPLHISLSPPVVLRTEQRTSFMECLATSIQASHVSLFTVVPDTLKWVSNRERTRWFLVLHVARPTGNELNRLLNRSNRTLAGFDQPPLYASSRGAPRNRAQASHGRDPRPSGTAPVEDYSDCFHISLGWSLREPSQAEKDRVARLGLGAVQNVEVKFDSVKVKIGNQVESIRLSAECSGPSSR